MPRKLASDAIRAAARLPPAAGSSDIHAVVAPAARPVANPLNTRATKSQGVLVATANRTVLARANPYGGRRGVPASDLVGQTAEDQERDEVAKDVNRINERERDAGKTERLLVKRIKRGRQSRTDERDRKSGGDDYHRNAAGKLTALHQ